MENDINKEKWINEALGSLEDMSRAQPRADLYEQITARLKQPKAVKVMALHAKQWAAAVLLLALNIGSVVYFADRHGNKTGTIASNPFAVEIQSESTYNY